MIIVIRSNSSSQYGVLKIQIYNLEDKRVMCDIKVEEFATRNYLYAQKPSLVFKGEKIYYVSCHSRKTLTEIDINNPTVRTTRDMSILPEDALLTGINASFAFGVIQNRQAWCYNFATSTLATYSCDTLVYVVDATWYCGFFMVFESHALVFFDPYSEGETLKVVTRFVADPIQLCQFRIVSEISIAFYLIILNQIVRERQVVVVDHLRLRENVGLWTCKRRDPIACHHWNWEVRFGKSLYIVY